MQNGMFLSFGIRMNNLKICALCCKCGGQRTVSWSLRFPAMWVLRTEVKFIRLSRQGCRDSSWVSVIQDMLSTMFSRLLALFP